MAATFDSTFEKGVAGGSSSPQSFVSNAGDVTGTVTANSDRALIGYAAFDRAKVDVGTVTLTWDLGGTNQVMTEIISVDMSSPGCVYLFGLKNPAAGNLTLQVAWTVSSGQTVTFGAISVYNVDQITGWNNSGSDTGTGTSASSTVTTNSGDLVIVNHINNNASSTTINQGTSAWVETDINENYAQGYKASASGSEAVSWALGSSVAWANVKVNVLQAVSGPGAGSDSSLVGVSESTANLITISITEETS